MVETFGTRLRRLRMAKGLRQNDLQEMTGIAASTIGHYEYNDFSASAYNLATLADALDVSMDYLWRGRELAPVVHGHWELVFEKTKCVKNGTIQDGMRPKQKCSRCGNTVGVHIPYYKYCPHCGAVMDEEG